MDVVRGPEAGLRPGAVERLILLVEESLLVASHLAVMGRPFGAASESEAGLRIVGAVERFLEQGLVDADTGGDTLRTLKRLGMARQGFASCLTEAKQAGAGKAVLGRTFKLEEEVRRGIETLRKGYGSMLADGAGQGGGGAGQGWRAVLQREVDSLEEELESLVEMERAGGVCERSGEETHPVPA